MGSSDERSGFSCRRRHQASRLVSSRLACLLLGLGGCNQTPSEVTDEGTSSTSIGEAGTTTSTGGSSSTTATLDETGIGSGSATSGGTSTGEIDMGEEAPIVVDIERFEPSPFGQ